MEINSLCLGLMGTMCYNIVSDNAAVVIDPGFVSSELVEFFKVNEDKEKWIFITHAHFDHIGFANELREKTGAKIAIGKDDAPALENPELNLAYVFRSTIKPFSADRLLVDGEEFIVGDLNFKILATPGHTVGSVCYLLGENLFSGDTLFYESIGRDDFPGGNREILTKSVKRLYELPDSTVVFPGHNQATTIGHEKKYNPWVTSVEAVTPDK